MQAVSPESPERRAEQPDHGESALQRRFGRGSFFLIVVKRVAVGVYSDGFIHAGNLAYLALLTVFPFFIVAAAIASLFGQNAETLRAVSSFLRTLPPSVAEILRKPIGDVLLARTGSLLWLGALVGLWTVGSFVETIRDIFRRAYGTKFSRPFWQYRLGSIAVIIGAVIVALISFMIQGLLTAAEQFIYRLLPWAERVAGWIALSRLIPGLLTFAALYVLFYSVTPAKYRYSKCRKWPGALFVTLWWGFATAGLPVILSRIGGYNLTYGGLAGVVLTLVFFYFIGLGISVAAHLNAALAETPHPELNNPPDSEAETETKREALAA